MSWVAKMLRSGPGPGLSASKISRFRAQGICAEGLSSTQSGSLRPPTALLSPGKQEQETGISPQHQQLPCQQVLYASPISFLCNVPSAWAMQSPDEKLLRGRLGTYHYFLAACSWHSQSLRCARAVTASLVLLSSLP